MDLARTTLEREGAAIASVSRLARRLLECPSYRFLVRIEGVRTMSPISCAVVPTTTLTAVHRRELVALAEESVGPTFERSYLERRLAIYPMVAMARDRHGLAAFELIDVRRRGLELVYLGPLFSRRGVYVALFAHCLERWLDAGKPFCMAMEIENPLVRDMLAHLLPTCAYPIRDEPPSECIRALGRIFAAEFAHVKGLDDLTMTTAIAEPMTRCGATIGRYQMMVVPCSGSGENGVQSREALRRELAQGLASIDALRGIRSWRGARDERHLLRADP